jgi:hypothetical protein
MRLFLLQYRPMTLDGYERRRHGAEASGIQAHRRGRTTRYVCAMTEVSFVVTVDNEAQFLPAVLTAIFAQERDFAREVF